MPRVAYTGHMGAALLAGGPTVQLTLARRGSPSGGPHVPLKMLVDTGADRTVIDEKKIALLGVPPIDAVSVAGVLNTPKMCPVFPVELILGMSDKPYKPGRERPATTLIGFGSRVVAMSRQGDHDGLLGRDFLSNFEFKYDGRNGNFELAAMVPRNVIASKGQQRAKRK